MGSPGCSRQCRTLLSLLLMTYAASAANLNAAANLNVAANLLSVQQLGEFEVLTEIQKQVDMVNDNLQKLSTAIDSSVEPTAEPSPSSPTDEPGPTDEPEPTGDTVFSVRRALPRLFLARAFKTLELESSLSAEPDNCDKYQDVTTTVDNANAALSLVVDQQFSNTTLDKLQTSNWELGNTTACVTAGKIVFTADEKNMVKTYISVAEKSGAEAADIIDAIVNPPTQAPEEDGFRAATIALGVLFSLAVVALIGLGIYTSRKGSDGHMS